MSRTDFNAHTIAEFRRNHGRVGGYFKGAPLLLLHTIGARSGKPRINPVMYLQDGKRYLVFASKGGADTNPDWYYNLKAHPDIQIEVGDETIEVHADEVVGAERNNLFKRQATLYPAFAGYQRQTKRTIPVIALTRTSGNPDDAFARDRPKIIPKRRSSADSRKVGRGPTSPSSGSP